MIAQLLSLSTANFWQGWAVPEKALFCGLVIVFGLTLVGFIVFGSVLGKLSGRKFVKSCKTVSNFANESGVIDDGNLEQFEATCFNEKTDKTFMEGWEAFKEARFDYPSTYIDSEKVKAKFSSRSFKVGLISTVAALMIFATVFVLYGIFQVKGGEAVDITLYSIVLAFPLILLLSYAFVKPEKKTSAAFDQMLEDLDTAVRLQRHVERKIDNSRLYDIENRIRDVIIHEQSKPIPSKKDQLEKQKAQALAEEELDDIRDELFDDEPEEEFVEEVNEPVEDVKEVEEEPAAEELVEEPAKEEEVPEEEPAKEEEPAPAPKKVIPFEPFINLLDAAIAKGYPKATMRKMANILVLAFGKFTEPAQRDALKNSIRKFIVQYKAAVERERAEEAAAAEAYGEWQNPDAE